jgi:hypothetical protein
MENQGSECAIIGWAIESKFVMNILQLCKPSPSKIQKGWSRDPYNRIAFKEGFCLNRVLSPTVE